MSSSSLSKQQHKYRQWLYYPLSNLMLYLCYTFMLYLYLGMKKVEPRRNCLAVLLNVHSSWMCEEKPLCMTPVSPSDVNGGTGTGTKRRVQSNSCDKPLITEGVFKKQELKNNQFFIQQATVDNKSKCDDCKIMRFLISIHMTPPKNN